MDVRLFDFQILQPREEEPIDTQTFVIQMFGINENGETFSVMVEDFKPYFFCLVPDDFTSYHKRMFLEHDILSKIDFRSIHLEEFCKLSLAFIRHSVAPV
jgi:DNA polymerase elongation subunit (family B)